LPRAQGRLLIELNERYRDSGVVPKESGVGTVADNGTKSLQATESAAAAVEELKAAAAVVVAAAAVVVVADGRYSEHTVWTEEEDRKDKWKNWSVEEAEVVLKSRMVDTSTRIAGRDSDRLCSSWRTTTTTGLDQSLLAVKPA
jgi:hypothetical protein